MGFRITSVTKSSDQLRRWSRQIRLPQVGEAGQERLAEAKVGIVGVGGLGSPAALYLAAAGVGTIGLIDDDEITLSDIQRQVLFGEGDVGRGKAEVGAARLRAMNERLEVATHVMRLTAGNALALLADYDIIIDGSDNFPTRYAVNDACVLLNKPNVYGSVLQFEGRASLFVSGRGPCYRCLFPEPPPHGTVPSCEEAGVLGFLPGVIGNIQAAEAVKWICGIGEPLIGRLLIVDMLAMSFQEFSIRRNPHCALCGEHPTITEPVSYVDTCAVAEWDVQPGDDYDLPERITPRIAHQRLQAGESLLLLDVREPVEFAMANLPDSVLIPLGELVGRCEAELGKHRNDEIVVICHHGIRSAMAADWLREQGFKRVKNLDGGIDRWARQADRLLPRY
jgi:molybdopterin/thiamine biosynthesis adenylyltransferase/rhodanese-related sulfurtransferase